MGNMVGKIINYGGAEYKITSCKSMLPDYPNMAKACEQAGKFPAFFWS